MGNIQLEVKEHNNSITKHNGSRKNDIEYRNIILDARKRICEKIFFIEMKYKSANSLEQEQLERELRKCGNELIKLVPPRKKVPLLYKEK